MDGLPVPPHFKALCLGVVAMGVEWLAWRDYTATCLVPGAEASLPLLSCVSEGLRVYFQEVHFILETALEGAQQGRRKIEWGHLGGSGS